MVKVINVSGNIDLIIKAGRVFDGQELLADRNLNILISGGLITRIRPESGPAPEYSRPTSVVDLSGHTVLPGLVDCHVHLALDGKDFNKSRELWTQEALLMERMESDLLKTLGRGIVAVRDGGDRQWIGFRARNMVNRRLLAGPRILTPGIALGKKGKYGAFLGPGITGDQIGEAVKETAGRGVDHIKVLVSGVVSFKNYRKVGDLHFTQAELKYLVSASHHLGLKVMAHASSDEASRMAVEAGADSLEHGYFISQTTLEAMAAKGIPWIPTLAPVASQARGRLREGRTPQELEIIEKTYLGQLKQVKKASAMGVILGAGSDAGATGVLHGDGLLDELYLLEEAGLGRDKILRAATRNSSLVLGLEKEMGMIRPGLPPHLIAVRGNPLKDLKDLENVDFMIIPSGG